MNKRGKGANLERDKLEIIKWVAGLRDRTIIERLKLLKDRSHKSDWWTEISDEERAAIEKGLEDVKMGRVASHKEVRKRYAKWL